MDFTINPRFDQLRSAIYFETGSLNGLAQAEYNDKFGFYQNLFGCYSYMQLTRDLTFKLHYPQGTPLLWQSHNSCAFTPTGTLSFGEMEITPKRVKINEKLCYDEYFDSAYRAWLEWGQGNNVEMNAAGIAATNALTESLVKNATLGARVSMVAGQLFDSTGSISFEDDTAMNIEQAFAKTSMSVKGWLQLAIETAAGGVDHLNVSTLIEAADVSGDGKTFTSDVLDLYDENFDECPGKLKDAIIEGGVGGFGFNFYPVWFVSPSIYRKLDTDWKALKESATINEPRITVEKFPYQTNRGQRNINVFKIDETIVIPTSEPTVYSQYLTGTPHFCYLGLSGVIQMGSSFANLPVANQNDVGIMVQRSDDAEDLGTFRFLSHALMGTAINDTNYLCGGYLYAEPA
jgi:hypothetical protein